MSSIPILQEARESVLARFGDKPVTQLNILRYKRPNADGSEDGKKIYWDNYIPAFLALAEKHAPGLVKPLYVSHDVQTLVPSPAGQPATHWDSVALVQYPNFDAFQRITTCEEYNQIALPHRLAALEDWQLITTLSPEA